MNNHDLTARFDEWLGGAQTMAHSELAGTTRVRCLTANDNANAARRKYSPAVTILKQVVSLTSAILLLAGVVRAQNPLGRIAGTVRDQSGAVVARATVTVTNDATNQQQISTTSADGTFLFPQLPPGSYSVTVELTGFKSPTYEHVTVDPGQEYSLPVSLELGEKDEIVQVTAGADLVHTTSPELNNTVSQRQILDLPLNGRNPLELIRLQAGVPGITNRGFTTINGGRPTWTQVTQDGINVQFNLNRVNALDAALNRPTSDIVGEFTITTNTQGADAAGGASQVKLITPSGGNEFHGSIYEFNRNSALAANDWFRNRDGIPRGFLNRNQFGGRLGGPVLKNKIFFFAYYEGFRQATQVTPNNIIPAHDDFLTGVFRYVRLSDRTIQTVNVLQLAGLPVDPKIRSLILDQVPPASKVNNFDVGDSRPVLLNTAGFRFNQSVRNTRDYFGFRADYELNPSHHFEFVATRMAEINDRSNTDTIHTRPFTFDDNKARLVIGAWRWIVSPRLQNELRVGASLAPYGFKSRQEPEATFFQVPLITNRLLSFEPSETNTRSRHWIDNASFQAGEHSLQLGSSLQQLPVRVLGYRRPGPTVSFGFSPAAPTDIQLTEARFPGGSISGTDLTTARNLVAFLGGIVSQVNQSFLLKDRSSGYGSGYGPNADYILNDLAFYFQDNWRLKPNLTVRAGLKWEYFTPFRHGGDLGTAPVFNGRSARETLLDPNGMVDFVKGGAWRSDLNNFGPSVGLAWDPFKDGRTSIRTGYTLAYVNEETMWIGSEVFLRGNPGWEKPVLLPNQFATVNGGLPAVATPLLRMPRSYADQLAENPGAPAAAIDPELRQPYVHEISLSVERELVRDLAVEGRYVSTMGRKLFRGIDLNQINAGGDFLDDFLRARSNGFLAQTATGVFNPAYNPNIPGSQPLTLIPSFGGGLLSQSTVTDSIKRGEVAGLADFYITQGIAGANGAFLPNPSIYSAILTLNGAESDYHAFQGEVRRRFENGVFGQLNYTFGKVLTNSSPAGVSRTEPLLDNARPELEKRRALFDVTHIINGNVVSELPFGAGKRFLNSSRLDRFISGWQVASIVHWQSGAPFSILAPRGTFNRSGRSAGNTANSILNRDQIKALFGIRKLPNGKVFYIDPAVTDPNTGRAVGPDNLNNAAGFPGQVFFNPAAGTVGELQRLQFDGPSQFAWDFSVIKRTKLTESSNVEFRAEFFNILNHPNFQVPGTDYDINSQQFGTISSQNPNTLPRVIQLALRINF